MKLVWDEGEGGRATPVTEFNCEVGLPIHYLLLIFRLLKGQLDITVTES